jgi:hypothetical protein
MPLEMTVVPLMDILQNIAAAVLIAAAVYIFYIGTTDS